MHKRQQIREQLRTVIDNAVDVDVYLNRVYPLSDPQAILIYPESENIDYVTQGNDRTQMRMLTVRVEVLVSGKVNYDNKIDDIMVKVEESLANTDLNGLAHDVKIASYQVEFSGEGDVPIGAGILNVNVVYTTQESNVGD